MKRWIATLTTMIVAGLVLMPGTDSAHGSHVCNPGFQGGHTPWPASRLITSNEIKWFSVRALNLCAFVRAEPSPPNANTFSFIRRINNSAGEGFIRTNDGVRHRCLVDHDQTFANGQWHEGWNTRCVQG